MDDFQQGQEDYWHYEFPRKPTNADYMAGWAIADDEFNELLADFPDENDDSEVS